MAAMGGGARRAAARLPLALLVWAALVARRVRAAVCTTTFSLLSDLASGSAGVVRALEYVDDGTNKLLVAGGEDMIMRVWTLSPLSTTPRTYSGHQETIWALEWISELSVLASGGGDGFIRFWPSSVLATAQACMGLADCCDGTGLGCRGEHVISWLQTGMARRRQVHSLAWISGGGTSGTLVSGWGDGSLRTWLYDGSAWAYGVDLQPNVYDSKDRTYDMVWMSGSSVLATASPDWPHPRLWSSLTTAGSYSYLTKALGDGDGKGLCPWAHCDAVLAIDTDSTGATLASGSMDNSIILWSYATKNRYARFAAHTDYVTSLVWLHSEDKLASGSADNTVRIWDATVAADTTSSTETLTGHTGSVNALVWISGLVELASADSDGSVKLWTC